MVAGVAAAFAQAFFLRMQVLVTHPGRIAAGISGLDAEHAGQRAHAFLRAPEAAHAEHDALRIGRQRRLRGGGRGIAHAAGRQQDQRGDDGQHVQDTTHGSFLGDAEARAGAVHRHGIRGLDLTGACRFRPAG